MSCKGTAVIKGYFIVAPGLRVQANPAALRLPHSICGCSCNVRHTGSPAFVATFAAAATAAAEAVSFLLWILRHLFFFFSNQSESRWREEKELFVTLKLFP